MKIYLIFALLSLILANRCPRIVCTKALVGSLCLSEVPTEEGNVHYVNSCESNQFCVQNRRENSLIEGYCQLNSNQGKLSEYSSCSVDSDCASNICFQSNCTGKENGSSCVSSKECKALSFCKQGKCTDSLKINSTCSEDEECIPGSDCIGGKCIGHYSIPSSTEIPGKNVLKNHKACISGYFDSSTQKCSEIRHSANGECDYGLTGNSSCEYFIAESNENVRISGTCSCRQNSERTSACRVESTSSDWLSFVEKYKQVASLGCPRDNLLYCSKVSLEDRIEFRELEFYSKGIDASESRCILHSSAWFLCFLLNSIVILLIYL